MAPAGYCVLMNTIAASFRRLVSVFNHLRRIQFRLPRAAPPPRQLEFF